ncbi:MAG: MBL fold metallo-hydrolase [Erysipelotrichaceae bacterium]|nr:MBL fold metallo-hydrolase [Erysipelotrichaceae bacterium]
MPEVVQINKDTYRIEDVKSRFYLLVGNERALLVDSGRTTMNAKEIAEQITNLPVVLLNTHADFDHIAGNDAFSTAYMHPSEYVNYFAGGQKHPNPTAIWDKQIIDLGNREIEVISIPGHTPGSVALLDKKYRALISGDSIQDGRIYMFGVFRNMVAYKQSLQKIVKYIDQFDYVYAAHGTFNLPSTIIYDLLDAVDKIAQQEVDYQEIIVDNQVVKQYSFDVAKFLLD